MKTIRGAVNFNYDLRKPMSAGQKSAVTKAFLAMVEYKTKRFVPIRKKRTETKKEYKTRRKIIKENMGQDTVRGNLLNGIYTDIPDTPEIKLKFVGTDLVSTTRSFKDRIVGADHQALAETPREEAERVWNDLDFDTIAINYSGFGRSMEFDKVDDDGSILDAFIEEVGNMSDEYKKVLKYAISGWVLRTVLA